MEQQQDEQITCASCGSSFLFSAAEAAARAERGHPSPPTLCKSCRRASRGKPEGARRNPRSPHASQGEGRSRPLRYASDVNGYRSPMPDPHFGAYPSYGQPSPRPRGTRDEYRAPGFRDAASDPRRDGRNYHAGRGRGFPITCAACGQPELIPFKPAVGQKVYCRTCFRAEKPT